MATDKNGKVLYEGINEEYLKEYNDFSKNH